MKRIVLILSALAAQSAHAGVYIETVTHDLRTNTTEPAQKMYVDGDSGRFVDDQGRVVLLKGGTIIAVDDKGRSYVPFDKTTMDALAKSIAKLMDAQKGELANMTEEQRAMAGDKLGMMGGEGKPSVEVVDTGKSDKVDGRDCRLWDVKRDGKLDEQLCVVPYANLPGKQDLQAVFAAYVKKFEEMAKSVPMLGGMMSGEFEAQAKLKGFPVRSRIYENGRLSDESEELLKIWREEAIPASMFEVPAGFTRKQMDLGPGAN